MAKKRSEERQIQDAVDIGRKNAELMPKVQNWCRHLEIEMESAGLVAQIYQLPVGMMSISCPHASAGGIMSMHLNHVATAFITSNCRGCPHHELVSLNNIGREILDKEDDVKARRVSDEERTKQVKHRLHELVSGDLTEALRRENITAQSVLELVALLDDETHHIEAAKKLVKAAEIAPEFFTQLAIEVICRNFPDLQHGKICMEIILQLGSKIGQLPEVAFLEARTCLEQTKNPDEACFLIGRYLEQHDLVPEPELIAAVVNTQWHGHYIPMVSPPSFEGSNFALKVIGQKTLDSLIAILKKRLEINGKHIRINTSYVIQSLIDDFPELAQRLVDPLIDSLELDDDIYQDSADGAACRAIAAIYARHPDFTQERMDAGYQRLSSEGKEALIRAYRFIVLGGRSLSDYGPEIAARFDLCIRQIIHPLLQFVSGLAHPVDVKAAASEVLELIAEYHPEYLHGCLDSLLGAVANLAHESVLVSEKQTSGLLDEMEKQGQQSIYSRTSRHIVDALKVVCAREPHAAMERLRQIVPNLDSSQLHLAAYKAELAAI